MRYGAAAIAENAILASRGRSCDLDSGTRWRCILEVCGVHHIHLGEVVHILEEYCRRNDVVHSKAGRDKDQPFRRNSVVGSAKEVWPIESWCQQMNGAAR